MTLLLTMQEAHVMSLELRRGAPLALPAAAKPRGRPRQKSIGEETFALHLRLDLIPNPEREYKFHPARRWRFDFCWVKEKVAVEIEGGTRNGKSRHTRHEGFERDSEKYNEAVILGWKLLRFTTQQVKSGIAINTLKRLMKHNIEEITEGVEL